MSETRNESITKDIIQVGGITLSVVAIASLAYFIGRSDGLELLDKIINDMPTNY